MNVNRLLGGLRTRLVLLTLLALFPLGLIALWQTFQAVDDARDLNEQTRIAATNISAIEQRARIKKAIGAGNALGAIVRSADLPTCRRAMREFLGSDPEFIFAGFIDVSGIMSCSTAGDEVFDFSRYETLQAAIDGGTVFIEVNTNGAISNENVLIVSTPVYEATTLLGFVSLSLPMALLNSGQASPDGITLIGVGTSGAPFALTSTLELTDAYLPRGLSPDEILARAGTNFLALDQTGDRRMFSVTEPIEGSYVIVGSWAQSDLVSLGTWRLALLPLMFALLMWASSVAVSYLGLSRLVLRPLAELRSAMRQFALGERALAGLDLQNAPDEFKDAERAFNRMALLITEGEARRMTDLHDKEVLLREVHHRVKNNLQMIASIMNLQARNAKTGEAREVLAGLQRRVRGLAMLHRSLYCDAGTSRVDAHELVSAVVSDASALLPDPSLGIGTDLASALLYPDQAVPLSMWLAEALTNAVKYVGTNASGVAFIHVALHVDAAGDVTLKVENSMGQPVAEASTNADSTGLGTKLMTAFTRQLEGTVDREDTADRYMLRLRFRIQDFQSETDNDSPGADQNAA